MCDLHSQFMQPLFGRSRIKCFNKGMAFFGIARLAGHNEVGDVGVSTQSLWLNVVEGHFYRHIARRSYFAIEAFAAMFFERNP